jgi:hypothetical protein
MVAGDAPRRDRSGALAIDGRAPPKVLAEPIYAA